jgi:hypothetical protein
MSIRLVHDADAEPLGDAETDLRMYLRGRIEYGIITSVMEENEMEEDYGNGPVTQKEITEAVAGAVAKYLANHGVSFAEFMKLFLNGQVSWPKPRRGAINA